MPFSVGDIVRGKVTGITKFGAFVALAEGKSGLVHISEISNQYVEKVEDYLKRDDQIDVKVLSISPEGKIALSVKQAQTKPKQREMIEWKVEDKSSEMSFEDKISQFLKVSNEKNSQLKSREGKRGTGQRARTK